MNTENVYCKSMGRNLVEFTSYMQECSKDSFHKYRVTVDVELGNFKKIRFFPVKIEVIQRIVNHPTIDYPCFAQRFFIQWIAIHWIGDLSTG